MGKFWSDQPLPRYDAKVLSDNGIRYLVDERGNRLPTENSIIEATRTLTEKARLARWVQQNGSAPAQRGRMFKRQIDRYVIDKDVPCPELIRPYWNSLLPVLQNIHDIRLVEGHVLHYYEGYSGKVGWVASFCNIPCAIKFKTSDRIKPIHEDEALRLAAYCGALNRQYGRRYSVEINHALLIVATPEGVSLNWFPPDKVMEYWENWLKKVAAFWGKKDAA